ncbi:MAG: recombinase [Flavobacteriaceae bacterium]|nr:recombinase [Flavobacteriaceae bacterium]
MKTISKLKKDLDKWFSLYIRLRDATDEGLCQCFTCGAVKYYNKGMQCGHFQSRRFLATRFDEQNCAPQCVACNMFRGGEQFKFALNLDAKYGDGKALELEYKARTIVNYSRLDYTSRISYYKEAVEKLKKEKGIE